jgi:(p)ppGpp synthase/HD superfamily hydrolase
MRDEGIAMLGSWQTAARRCSCEGFLKRRRLGRMHGGRRRVDGAPFIVHPLGVATLLYHADAPDHLIAAGAMHDLIEKTGVSPSELRERSWGRITELVLAVAMTTGSSAPRSETVLLAV